MCLLKSSKQHLELRCTNKITSDPKTSMFILRRNSGSVCERMMLSGFLEKIRKMKTTMRLFPFRHVLTVVQEQLECLLLVSIHRGAAVKTCGIPVKSSFLQHLNFITQHTSAQHLKMCLSVSKNAFHLVSKSLVLKKSRHLISHRQ